MASRTRARSARRPARARGRRGWNLRTERIALPVAAASALVAVGVLAGTLRLPPWAAWLAGWSAVTFGVYGIDTSLARSGRRRIPERTLHLLALLGGAAGGWLGMLVFRHKRRSSGVVAWLVAATALELVALVALVAFLAGLRG